MYLLAGLEERDVLLPHRNLRAGARISPSAGRAVLGRKDPEPAQFDPISPRQRGSDRIQDSVDDVFDVTLVEMWILRGDALDQFGFDHSPRLDISRITMVAKGRKTVKLPVLPEHDCDLIGCGFQVGIGASLRRLHAS